MLPIVQAGEDGLSTTILAIHTILLENQIPEENKTACRCISSPHSLLPPRLGAATLYADPYGQALALDFKALPRPLPPLPLLPARTTRAQNVEGGGWSEEGGGRSGGP